MSTAARGTAQRVAQRLWRPASSSVPARRYLHASQRVYDEGSSSSSPSSSSSSSAPALRDADAAPAPQTLDDLIGGGMDMPASSSSSAFDDLFSGPNPFPRAEAAQHGAGPSQYDPFHRERAGGRGTTRERRPPRDRAEPPSAGSRGMEARMSPQERDAWVRLLDDVSGKFGDSSSDSSANAYPAGLPKEPGDAFSPLERFVHRNQLRPNDRQAGSSRSSRNGAPAEESNLYRLASLGEKGDFSFVARMEETDLTSAVDRAEQSMNLCNDEAELWAWAARDVFGFDQDEYMRRVRSAKLSREAAAARRVRGPKAKQTEQDKIAAPPKKDPDSANAVTTKHAPFGISTSLYAPVVHRLFLQLRNRFNSPLSALSLLNVVRGLGPQSLVLGYTPELLSEAVATRWEAMRDLGGACETLKEAKALGTLNRRRKRSPLPAASGAEAGSEGAEEKHPVDAVVKTITQVSEAARVDVLQARTRHLLEQADRLESEREAQPPPPPPATKPSKEDKEKDDFFADWLKDDDDEVNTSAPSEPATPAPAAKPTTVSTASLPLPALDALRIVDQMGSLAGLNRGAARRGKQRSTEQDQQDGGGRGRAASSNFVPPQSRRERDPHSSWGFSA